ncbi:uncharacterized protein LOC141704837 [Apium graveolens]|uniref:uncharacterized protein LOC141704837 n=1 Tax=Apium graveolens TaxID=4045 RepID=UPI003D794920
MTPTTPPIFYCKKGKMDKENCNAGHVNCSGNMQSQVLQAYGTSDFAVVCLHVTIYFAVNQYNNVHGDIPRKKGRSRKDITVENITGVKDLQFTRKRGRPKKYDDFVPLELVDPQTPGRPRKYSIDSSNTPQSIVKNYSGNESNSGAHFNSFYHTPLLDITNVQADSIILNPTNQKNKSKSEKGMYNASPRDLNVDFQRSTPCEDEMQNNNFWDCDIEDDFDSAELFYEFAECDGTEEDHQPSNLSHYGADAIDLKSLPLCPEYNSLGQVTLPKIQPTPEYLHELHHDPVRGPKFLQNIRAYNSMVCMTSNGAQIDHSVNKSKGPWVYRILGLHYHQYGTLMPNDSRTPKFCQLYIYDTQNEIENRLKVIGQVNGNSIDRDVLQGILNMLDEVNPLVSKFRMARDRFEEDKIVDLKIFMKVHRSESGRENSMSNGDEVATLIVGDPTYTCGKRDILIHNKVLGLERISDLHPLMMSLQYPLLFPRGEDGFHEKIKYSNQNKVEGKKREYVSIKGFYSYQFQVRPDEGQTLRNGGRLFQQFVVDAFSSVEQSRLILLSLNQDKLRSELYHNLRDIVSKDDLVAPSSVGKGYVLPLLSLWVEIQEMLKHVPSKQPQDNPDLLARVFKLKLDQLYDDIKNKNCFGKCISEYQKRGLPHAHILVWLDKKSLSFLHSNIDKFVSAEIPDYKKDPYGYAAVKQFMMHGPCGAGHEKSPCMKGGRCSKNFSKKYCSTTIFDDCGFPVYKRRKTRHTVKCRGENLDNQWMGFDRATVLMKSSSDQDSNGQPVRKARNEIKIYIDGRYVCGPEACHRIFGFDIDHRSVPVERLSFHLPNQKSVSFKETDNLKKEAYFALGLLNDDKEWHEAFLENSSAAFPIHLRHIFVHIITNCNVSDIRKLWNSHWEPMSVDILRKRRELTGVPSLTLTQEELEYYTLAEIEILLNSIGKSLQYFPSMPMPPASYLERNRNRLIVEETSYDIVEMCREHNKLFFQLNEEHMNVYHAILDSISTKVGGIFFVYGSGGCGKTFLWNTIITKLRSDRKIVLPVASSGIAATLLPGGRTAHSRFKIPLKLDDTSMCSIAQNSDIAELLKRTSLIIWDEVPMQGRYAFECLDRTLRDIMKYVSVDRGEKPFGGITMLLGGDFRQILPVVPKGSRSDIVGASVTSSPLWCQCKLFKLVRNMRLNVDNTDEEKIRRNKFCQWVLDIGDGKAGNVVDSCTESDFTIDVPPKFCILSDSATIDDLIKHTYPDLETNFMDLIYLQKRAILTPRNKVVDHVNKLILDKIPGECYSYKSADSVRTVTNDDDDDLSATFSVKYLNSIKGLCNGTRMIVRKCLKHTILCEIMTGQFGGVRHIIPRIELCPTDTTLPFNLIRVQFPVQYYVVVSRVTSPDGLIMLIEKPEGGTTSTTKNVVYEEVFYDLES